MSNKVEIVGEVREIKKVCFVSYIIIFIFTIVYVNPLYANTRTVKIGYLPNYGTIFDLESKDRIGYGYDYFNEISKYTEWQYEYIPCTWEEGLELLEKGEIDIFGPMQKTKEREALFNITEENWGYESVTLYAYENSTLAYEDFENFNGMKVGVQNQNFYLEDMASYCKRNNIEVELVETDGKDIEKELEDGKYDVFLGGDLHSIPHTKVVGKITSLPFYYATKKGDDQLYKDLQEALQQIRMNKPTFQIDLYEKYYGNQLISSIIFTKQELSTMKKYPKLVVEIEPNAAPLQYIDPITGKAKGIIVGLLNEISEDCEIEFEYKASTHETGMCEGEADLYAGYHKERYNQVMNLTDSLLTVPMVFVAQRDTEVSGPNKVAMARLDNIDMASVASEYPELVIEEYLDISDISKALLEEKVNLAITSLYTFNELIKDGKYNNYMAYPTGIELSIDLGVSTDLPKELVTIINKAIARISKDKKDSIIISNTIEYARETSFQSFMKKYFIEIVLGIILLLLLIIILIIIILYTLSSKKKALQKVAYQDQVTELSTLIKFKLDVAKALEKAKPGEYMIVSLDIDNFSYINDWLGYEEGNKILKIIGDGFYRNAQDQTLIARSGADIFLIFTKVIHMENYLPMESYNEMVMDQVEVLKKWNYQLTFNSGIYQIHDLKQDIAHMIDCADIARRNAKGQYGDSVSEYTESVDQEIQQQRQIVLEMKQALEHHDFKMLLQPKINLSNGKIEGAEALVRWYKANGEVIYPNDFIQLFEKNGFIYHLDLYMFEEACKWIKAYKKKGIAFLPKISVNLSKVTLLSDGLCDTLMDYINKWNVNTKNIELELTESAFSERMVETMQVVTELKRLGFTISLDDFGSGYSSLNMLQDIAVDTIKIDKGFIKNTVLTNNELEIIHSIVTIAKVLKMEIVIEGVETKEQAEQLREIGCDLAQGYYFAKPLELGEFERLLIEQHSK